MKKRTLLIVLAVISPMFAATNADATGNHGGHGTHKMPMQGDGSDMSCHIADNTTDAAEKQPGGALYTGPAAKHHMKKDEATPEMKGAHVDHKQRHGGAFFMAPNKMHHLEGIFSERCGFRVVFYNAFTKHIHAIQFRAFIKVVPDSQDEPEVIRFLSLNADKTALQADIGSDVTRPFDIELYVEFPGDAEPQLFNFKISTPRN